MQLYTIPSVIELVYVEFVIVVWETYLERIT